MKKEKNNIKKNKGRNEMADSEEVLKQEIPEEAEAGEAEAKDDVAVLADKIAAAFPEIQVQISKTHRDCMKFY